MNKNKVSLDTIISDEIRCMIFDENLLSYGDKLPSENELCAKFNCSKYILKQSLETLKNEHVLVQKDNDWYVVKMPRIRKYINSFESLTKNLNQSNFKSTKKLIESKILTVDSELANLTHLPIGSDLFFFKRIRFIGKEPICIEKDYISRILCPDLNKYDIVNNSLYEVLKDQYNISVDRGIEQLKVIKASKEEGSLLKIKKATPLIKQYGFIFSDEGDEVEYTESIMKIERFEFIK